MYKCRKIEQSSIAYLELNKAAAQFGLLFEVRLGLSIEALDPNKKLQSIQSPSSHEPYLKNTFLG